MFPAGSPSRGGDVTVYIRWYKPNELAHYSYSILGVWFCLNGPFNYLYFHKFSHQFSAFSHIVLPALVLPYRSFLIVDLVVHCVGLIAAVSCNRKRLNVNGRYTCLFSFLSGSCRQPVVLVCYLRLTVGRNVFCTRRQYVATLLVPALDEKTMLTVVGTLGLLCAVSSSWLGNHVESLHPRSDDDSPLEVVIEKLSRDLGALQGQLDAQKHDLDTQKLKIAELEGKC